MKTTSSTYSMVLAAALLIVSAVAAADDLPVQAGRIWAPAGDLVGTGNHWALAGEFMDAYGSGAKAAEDAWRVDEHRHAGLFGWRRVRDDGRRLSLRGAGDYGSGAGASGAVALDWGAPGRYAIAASYRSFHHHYDDTSEMRAPVFRLDPPPPALDPAPVLDWNRARISVRHHVRDGLDVSAGAVQTRRSGEKSSLARGMLVAGEAPPASRAFDTTAREFWLRGAYARGGFAGDLRLSHRGADGTRTLDTRHAYEADGELWSARLKASLDVGDGLRVLGAAATSRLESAQFETYQGNRLTSPGDANTDTGRLGLIKKLGRASTLRLSAGLRSLNSEGRVDFGDATLQAADRSRSSRDLRAVLTTTALDRTRLRLHYKYRSSDLDETRALDGVPGSGLEGDSQTTAQDRRDQEVGFRGRVRLGARTVLKARAEWRGSEVEKLDTWDTTSGEPWHFWMGDREREQYGGRVALQARPLRDLRVDLGHRVVERTFRRLDLENTETTWRARRGYVAASWLANDRLTLLGTVSLGREEYRLTDGPDAEAGMAPLVYDGTTLRFAPGATLKLGETLRVEGHYEGVRHEDAAGTGGVSDDVMSDYNRLLVRASWEFSPGKTAHAAFRRHEFDENRWDDYILDLYTLALSGRF